MGEKGVRTLKKMKLKAELPQNSLILSEIRFGKVFSNSVGAYDVVQGYHIRT